MSGTTDDRDEIRFSLDRNDHVIAHRYNRYLHRWIRMSLDTARAYLWFDFAVDVTSDEIKADPRLDHAAITRKPAAL